MTLRGRGRRNRAGQARRWSDLHEAKSGSRETCGPASCSTIPVAVSGLGGVKAVSAGCQFSLTLLSNGTAKAWGCKQVRTTGQRNDQQK